ncbi:hypothetical protein LZ554_005987 [Drepanopeziza brunnea f. sp. 'monogermtubi']|nr:hypothetical protein LZ554_005987 [Drepanopeziza brunnea f. sp. 'monogermtubi']
MLGTRNNTVTPLLPGLEASSKTIKTIESNESRPVADDTEDIEEIFRHDLAAGSANRLLVLTLIASKDEQNEETSDPIEGIETTSETGGGEIETSSGLSAETNRGILALRLR